MNDRINTPEAREAAEAESQRLARVQKVEARRLPEDEERKRLQRERTAKSRAKTKAASVVETQEARERRLKQELSDVADRLRQERDDDILYELSGEGLEEFGPNSPEENAELQINIDDYLSSVESMPFEDLYRYLSVTSPGRAILKSFGIEPLAPGHFMDSRGIHKYSSQVGRMVQCTDDGSWVYTLADYEMRPKSAATIQSEAKMYSPAIRETKAHDLKIKLELTRIKAIEEERRHREFLRGLEKQYLAARRASKEKQVREIKARENA